MTPTTKNQLQDTNNDFVYDAAGNLIHPGPTGTYVFDAENHLISAGGMAYLYDGDGKRVGKAPANTPTQPNYLYWYGTGSQILEETDSAGNYQYLDMYFDGKLLKRMESDNWVDTFFHDALGNVRCVYGDGDPDGGCSDYYPFGGERPVSNGGVNVSFKFTGKERDSESGLDDFGLRYFGSSMGRFMSPDSIANDWELANPQTWNRYAYARNNPLIYVDPDGAAVELICTGGNADQCAAQRQAALQTLQNGVGNKQAADSLYINEVKDGDNTRYFVGIKGDVGSFENLSSGAKDLGELVGAKQVVEFGVTNNDLPGAGKGEGAHTYAPGEIGNANPRVLVNPSAVATASNFFQDTIFGASRFGSGKINDTTNEIAAFHEFGHVWKMWQNINAARNGVIPGANGIDPRLNTSSEALRSENRMRQQVYGPIGPNNAERKIHD